MFVNYGSVISFVYIGGLTVAYTIYVWLASYQTVWVTQNQYACIITVILWFLYILMLFMHRGNIKRLINHTESKIDFKGKIKKVFCHKKGEEIIDEEYVNHAPEKEIVIDTNSMQSDNQSTEENSSQENNDKSNGN